ncbi:Response regulator receiver ATP-binding histidine kinase, cheA family [Cupriavidus taiwanensis]|uniref:Chemotaxis protein CheA n=1 Tax=Cupriavidus taiwanensis TaxID=164546 RepID=A0A375E8Q1_9BURK|nr:hybrid sensor histidine kinase/response regulator [Cupriavidus taiwanensis]SOZ66477.1 Response regulator receiver ATP-binding histidine kinase, cheA family [Cupriavidus taiwanensis]SOZ67274.1 Response regulator receiver ATP-binding histidine kinase, cheA family [Cupriavidus taiwanensis]SOZ70770.1 Response regulator receiver ATP-binding histidine kinase, cheA family [Cupriavidus taiwanensis]SPA08922.1 Response regulator receiver ATP-binding histidine kinase, cheA family [Cupriavidus taiwanens
MNPEQLRDASLLELFALEADAQAEILNAGLLALERNPGAPEQLEACMRAAHSLKGAARIVGLDGGVRLAHAMEDCLVAAQGGMPLAAAHIDALLQGTDLLLRIGHPPGGDPDWSDHAGRAEIDAVIQRLCSLDGGEAPAQPAAADAPASAAATASPPAPPLPAEPEPAPVAPMAAHAGDGHERMLRINADALDQLLALSGEAMVESHWLRPFGASLQKARRQQARALRAADALQQVLREAQDGDGAHALAAAHAALAELRQLLDDGHQQLAARLDEFEQYDHRATRLARRLYDGALASRMRPLSDGLAGYARMVRDLGRALGKSVHLELSGAGTQVDRDILEALDAPLAHLLRNAVDHGIEAPAVRAAQGKPPEGRVMLHARHNAGRLQIEISDDGAGVDLEALRRAIVRRRLASEDTAARLSQAELLDFLLLPGFSMRDTVSEVSGRGVGLDAVQEMVRRVRGSLRLTQQPGHGLHFSLELPLTLSVVRTLLVDVAGEAYAFPLGRVLRATSVARGEIEQTEGHQHFRHEGRAIGLVSAAQVLQRAGADAAPAGEQVPVVIIGEGERTYGIAVDRMLGERLLVVQPLPAALGKIRDIAAGSLTDDGTPVLIFDVEDMIRSVEKLVSEGRIEGVRQGAAASVQTRARRVLVVDDSLTVRELQRKLLAGRGYDVTVAVDGMDGWNVLRAEPFDLVITDIDMPRMDGIELVRRIRQDAALRQLPVMVVSYKDREQDRQRGLEAGADYYLAKGSFHDAALLDAVQDLIGEARP